MESDDEKSKTEDIGEIVDADEWLDIDIREPISLPYPKKKTFQYIWFKGSFNALENHEELYGISIAKLSMVNRSCFRHDEKKI